MGLQKYFLSEPPWCYLWSTVKSEREIDRKSIIKAESCKNPLLVVWEDTTDGGRKTCSKWPKGKEGGRLNIREGSMDYKAEVCKNP